MREAIKLCIEHWERMINWVKDKCDLGYTPNGYKMKLAIGESWYGNDCALCQMCIDKKTLRMDCNKCPIVKIYNESCNELIWKSINAASTWRNWLRFSEEMLKILKAL